MFHLEKGFADEMIRHATAEQPQECCGILAGAAGKVMKLFNAINAEKSSVRYSIDGKCLFRIYQETRRRGCDFIGIYHSHPATEAFPSETDLKLAFWPDSLYLIISLRDPNQPMIRAFRIADHKITEEELKITEDGVSA